MLMLKKTITCLLAVVALSWALAGLAPPAEAAGKIAVFDLQRAISKSRKGQAVKARLVAKFDSLQKQLKVREAELERLQKELESQAATLSSEAKYEKEKTLRKKIRDFQDMYRDYSEQMKKAEMESTQPIVNGLLKVAQGLGKQRGFDLIVEAQKAGVVYAPNDADITDEVIRLFDAQK